MHIGNLALTAFLAQAAPAATPPDTAQHLECMNPADTVPAIELTDSAFFVQHTSGADRSRLDSCYTFLRELLVTTLQRHWRGEFTFEQLAERYPKVRTYAFFQPASFQLHSGRGAVYVSFLNNDGFLPTIRLVNDTERGILEFGYHTSMGASLAWAAPIPVQ